MCGIAFTYHRNSASEALVPSLKQALVRMSHRGPDDEGLWHQNSCAIGHRRLSIIDLAKSRQPMQDPGQRYVFSYNGEVYNYKQLRKELAPHWFFRTQGDTEVVLAGLITCGPSFLKRMEGMWALVLWDSRRETLFLARDRIGKKPLYYQNSLSSFICASELPALQCLAPTSWREDLDSTADFFRYGYYLPGTTAFKGVKEVLPGHLLEWQPGEPIRQKAYWTLPLGGYHGSERMARAQLRRRFTQAVERRLVADVEVGAFLSGGVDSSLVVGTITKQLGLQVKTFTIGFKEKSYDERRFAQLVARSCGTDHQVKIHEEWNRNQLIQLILNNIGQPFADSSLLPTAMVSELASTKLKVVLSGDGGDELFSGYQRYQARSILRWYMRLPPKLRLDIHRLIRLMPEPMSHHSRSIIKKAHLFIDIANRFNSESSYVAPVMYAQEQFRRLLPDLALRGHKAPKLPEECSIDDLQRMMYADALIYLPQDILLKVDRSSMAFSLEARAPFLDRRVIELAFSLPRSWHRSGMRGKRLLAKTFQGLVPQVIWRRRKQGFGVPIHSWFRNGLGEELVHLLDITTTPIQSAFVRNLLSEHRQGHRDHGSRLWQLYLYLLWLVEKPWQAGCR